MRKDVGLPDYTIFYFLIQMRRPDLRPFPNGGRQREDVKLRRDQKGKKTESESQGEISNKAQAVRPAAPVATPTAATS